MSDACNAFWNTFAGRSHGSVVVKIRVEDLKGMFQKGRFVIDEAGRLEIMRIRRGLDVRTLRLFNEGGDLVSDPDFNLCRTIH